MVERTDEPSRRPRRLLRAPTYVLGQLARAAATELNTHLARVDLSLRSYQVLVCLAEFGQVSQRYVCDAIAVDSSDMVRILDRLEDLGYVTRSRDPTDRRRQLVLLSATGQRALVKGHRVIGQVSNGLLSRLSPAERATLHRLALQALGEPTELADDMARDSIAPGPGKPRR